MLVKKVDDATLRVVTQGDHAKLAADLLSLWRVPELVQHPRRSALLTATRHHDDGWQGLDAAPRVGASGEPLDFVSLPLELRVEAWKRSAQPSSGAVADDPWARLLVLRHSFELTTHNPSPVASALGEALEEEMTERLEPRFEEREVLESDYRWLQLADQLSLLLCIGEPGPCSVDRWHGLWRDQELYLEPFPLAGATRFSVASRRIANRHYPDATDLAVELATSRWAHTEFRLLPLEN